MSDKQEKAKLLSEMQVFLGSKFLPEKTWPEEMFLEAEPPLAEVKAEVVKQVEKSPAKPAGE